MSKNSKISFFLFLGAIFIISFIFLLFFQKYSMDGNKIVGLKINGNKIKAEIVNTSEKIEKGLAGRRGLCKNCGMLFEFQKKGNYSFWMKGMKFGIDIIWIEGDKVVYVAKNIPADFQGSITPKVRSDKVLEIDFGMSQKMNIKIGDKVEF